MSEPLTILHFNDVYNIEPQKLEPAGGGARMAHYVKSLEQLKPLVLFSGDALNPSLMSIFLKGEQMIPILNAIGVHCAVYGNHDFDFGVDHLEDFAEQTTFPWLMSNIVDKINNEPLARGQIKHMIDWHGTKVGLMGLVEEEWIDTLSTIDPADIVFQDFVEVGNQLAAELRQEGADIVIALTHMRWPNDRKVAELVDVDLVLGGHDHDYNVEKVNGKYVVKSGTDFRELSKITIKRGTAGLDIDIEHIELDSSCPEDEEVKAEVFRLTGDIDSKMDEHLGNMGVSLDGRFASVRTQETNLGNFITDIILEAVPADVCLLNSGTLRSDRIHQRGEFKLRDLMTILPLVDPLCVIEISGEGLVAALENGVSQYPKLEGRFPQLAGVSFAYDPSKPAGQRVEPGLVKVQDEYIDLEKKYRLCTKEYLASGKDGYDVFKDCCIVVDPEQCPSISTAVRNHFESVQILLKEKPCRSGHRQSLCSIVRRTLLIRQTIKSFTSSSSLKLSSSSTDSKDGDCAGGASCEVTAQTTFSSMEENMKYVFSRDSIIADPAHLAHLAKVTQAFMKPVNTPPKTAVKSAPRPNMTHAFVRQVSINDVESEQSHLCPKVDGRIVVLDDQKRKTMLALRLSPEKKNMQKDVIREDSNSSRENSIEENSF